MRLIKNKTVATALLLFVLPQQVMAGATVGLVQAMNRFYFESSPLVQAIIVSALTLFMVGLFLHYLSKKYSPVRVYILTTIPIIAVSVGYLIEERRGSEEFGIALLIPVFLFWGYRYLKYDLGGIFKDHKKKKTMKVISKRLYEPMIELSYALIERKKMLEMESSMTKRFVLWRSVRKTKANLHEKYKEFNSVVDNNISDDVDIKNQILTDFDAVKSKADPEWGPAIDDVFYHLLVSR